VPTSRPSRRPVLVCIDVEPGGLPHDPDPRPSWDGFEQAHESLARLRPRLAAATGRPVHFSWFLRMDPQIESVFGSAAWVAERHGEIVRELAAMGDEIGLHCHAWRWDVRRSGWFVDLSDRRWIDHCVRTAFTAFRASLGRPSESFRFGDAWMDDATLALVEKLGARFDLTVEPGGHGPCISEPFAGTSVDYAGAPRHPYRPSRRDFRKPGRWRARRLWEIPLTTATDAGALESLRERATVENGDGEGGGALEGWHDRTDEDVIAGWAYDPSRPDRVVAVDVYDGGTRVARIDASAFRPDLLAARKGDGRHAFELPVPDRLRDGNAHTIAVRIAGTEITLAGTPHEIRCRPGDGTAAVFRAFFVAFNPPILRGMIESVLDRERSPYLAMILRTGVWPPDEEARVERNLEYLLSRRDVDRMLIATPAEAIALLHASESRSRR
jgi:peptidoglycan/xylan/chitin deacetylase (PgdA/CDA1 family)